VTVTQTNGECVRQPKQRKTRIFCRFRDGAPVQNVRDTARVTEESRCRRPLVVEDDTHEGTVNLQAAVIVNEAQPPKLVHKETHP
jgi:hypothetical protein